MQDIQQKLYDKEFRARLCADPKGVLMELNQIDANTDMEFRIVKSTKETTYIALEQYSGELDLENIQAAGSSGCVGTASTICSTVFTASSAASQCI